MERRPKIGITTRLELGTGRFYLDRRYSAAIEASGGTPFLIPLIPKPNYIRRVLDDVDGLLLPGSNTDVDPSYFGEEPHPKLRTVIPEKDRTDMLALEMAEQLGLPILAICFGMQMLNVYRGGSVIQDLESAGIGSVKHDQGEPYDRNSHSVVIESGSRLAELKPVALSGGSIKVNSSHHQAVKEIGRDLLIAARASDGVVEAIEDPREWKWVIGVQWHPEITFEQDAISQELFNVFVETARRFGEVKVANAAVQMA